MNLDEDEYGAELYDEPGLSSGASLALGLVIMWAVIIALFFLIPTA